MQVPAARNAPVAYDDEVEVEVLRGEDGAGDAPAGGRAAEVGDDSVVAAGACVTKSVKPNTMVAGVPAVQKKKRPQ